jgi:hypothetical protein
MKIYRFLPLLILISFNLNAQKAKIQWGPEYKTKVGQFGIQLIGVDDDNFYLLNELKKKKKNVLRYDLEKEEFTEYDFNLEYNDEFLEKTTFIKTRDKIIGLSAMLYKKEDIFRLVVFDIENGEFSKPRPVFEHDFRKYTKGVMPLLYVPESNDDIDASVFQSQDSSKIFFFNVFSNQDTRKEDKIVIAVFDDDMNLLWDKIQDIPYKDKAFNIEKAIVTNNGKEVFIIGKYFEKKRKYNYKVFKISKNEVKEFDIILNDKIAPVALTAYYQEQNQSLIFGGLYNLKDKNYIHGVFSGKLKHENTTIDDLSYSKFTTDERGANEKDDYSIVGSFKLDNGNFQFLAEKRYVNSSGGGSDGSIRYVDYHNDDFIFVTLDGKGEIIKKQKIERKSASLSPRKGHAFFRYADHTYLLFDAKISSEDKKKYHLKVMKIHNIGKLFCFNSNGKTVRKKMLFTSTDKRYFYFDIFPGIFNNELIFLGGQIGNSGLEQWKSKRVLQLGTINLGNFK